MPYLRFSELSTARRAFVRQCQQMGFGKIVGVAVREGQPVFTDQTELLFDVKLDSDENPRPEQDLRDFAVTGEIVRLFSKLDAIGNGTIEHVEVRAGIPRRIVFKAPVSAIK